jgi:glucose-6-phosphate-specific signal transduction histidine kinase
MLTITVDDNGSCEPAGVGTAGHGIVGMREPASALGGWLSAGRRTDGHGFRVTAMLPIPAGARA